MGISDIRRQAKKARDKKLARSSEGLQHEESSSKQAHLGARVGLGSMGQASLSDAADSHLSEDEREDFHAKRRAAETLARERRQLDDKYGDAVREYEADMDPASVGPVERALSRATESLEHRRKRKRQAREHTLIDALLGVRRLDEDDLDLAHLFEDRATGKDIREAVSRADEANRRGDKETARKLLEGVLSPSGTNEALLALTGTGEHGRPTPHHVAVVDASRALGIPPSESLAELASSGAIGGENLLQAVGGIASSAPASRLPGSGDPLLLGEGTGGLEQGRERRGEHDDADNEAFSTGQSYPLATGSDRLAMDSASFDGIVAAVDRARQAVADVGGDPAALELTGDIRGSNAEVDALLKAGGAAGLLSSHGRRVQRARQQLGELV